MAFQFASRVVPTLALGTVATLAAPAAPQAWGVQEGTTAFDATWDIAPDGAGGVFEATESWGALSGTHFGGADVVVTRRSHTGEVLWSHQLGGGLSEKARGIAADGVGGVYVAGTIHLDLSQGLGRNAFVSRVDPSGSIVWSAVLKTVDGDGHWHQTQDAVEDGAGGVFVVGTTTGSLFGSNPDFDYDIWIAHYDAGGTLLWGRQLASQVTDDVYTVISDGAGGAVLCGQTWGVIGATGQVSPPEAYYARYDASGSLLWVRQFTSGETTSCRSVALDDVGGLFLLGETTGTFAAGGDGGPDVFLRRVDASGNEVWTVQFGIAGVDEAGDLFVAPDGVLFASGQTREDFGAAGAGEFELWLGRFAVDGTQLSMLQLGGDDNVFVKGLASDGGAGAFLAGGTPGALFTGNTGLWDLWSARFDSCDFQPALAYCVSTPNSTGQGASMDSAGSRYVANNDFSLSALGCPANELGIFIMGPGQASTPFGDGVLCIGGGVSRLLPAQAVDAGGQASLQLDLEDPASPASQVTPGSTWNFQFWYRDAASTGAGFNLSNGLSATFCP